QTADRRPLAPGQSAASGAPADRNHRAMSAAQSKGRIAIVGGGLAGLATAVALSDRGFELELHETRRRLGGRATSFYDSASGEWIDHCQHVSMGCCTNLADFCRRTGLAEFFRRDRVLYFFGPDGRCNRLSASRWLPAPLHLAPAFLRLGYLSLGERLSVARTLLRLARLNLPDDAGQPTIGDWLRRQGQSDRAIELFWSTVLVSALGEELDRASLVHAKKVFVDGFVAARQAYELDVPRVPLGELYGERLETWLGRHGVALHLGSDVRRVVADAGRVRSIVLGDGTRRDLDGLVIAVTWRRLRELFDDDLWSSLPELAGVEQIDAAPITGVHLWFDRPITALPHAVLLGRLSQWLFNRGDANERLSLPGHYYQVVISASRSLAGRERADVIEEILGDLASIWPATREAKLLRWRIVTEQSAVFSVRPGIDRLRPRQQTSLANLALAGDWTDTGWPSTMEGAVRGGYLAAEAILRAVGIGQQILVPDLKRGLLARWLP
ncbi:MAG TPA: hydroxysqualene dehydroxylase HpnE, partial [Pirellulales bacterium]|nr:hydroxysqualene dehydroxylase HpnE [Pirellulales bacterium]